MAKRFSAAPLISTAGYTPAQHVVVTDASLEERISLVTALNRIFAATADERWRDSEAELKRRLKSLVERMAPLVGNTMEEVEDALTEGGQVWLKEDTCLCNKEINPGKTPLVFHVETKLVLKDVSLCSGDVTFEGPGVVELETPLCVGGCGVVLHVNTSMTASQDAIDIWDGPLTIDSSNNSKIRGGSDGDWTAVTVNAEWPKREPSLIINGGDFSVGPDALKQGNACIYSKGAVVEINGGVFSTDAEYSGRKWVLNVKDGSKGRFIVKGGEFKDFDPAHPGTSPCGDVSFLAEGYMSYSKDGNAYTVEKKRDLTETEKQTTLSAILAGPNDVALGFDVIGGGPYLLKGDKTVDLNGHSITSSNDVGLRVQSGKIILKGEGVVKGSPGYGFALDILKDGDVTIQSGTYESNVTEDNKGYAAVIVDGGKLTVEGGSFKAETSGDGKRYAVNIQDGSGGSITVKGGRFWQFNPADPHTDPENKSYVADGYRTALHGEWYEVVPADAAVESETEDELSLIASQGGKITLTKPVTLSKSLEVKAPSEITLIGKLTVDEGSLHFTSGKSVIMGGGGIDVPAGKNAYCVRVDKNAEVTITAGVYHNSSELAETCVFCTGGKLNIEGGEFKSEHQYNNQYWPVNCLDSDPGEVRITGGRFWKFDPSKGDPRGSSQTGPSFVPEGWKAEKEDDDWYRVVPV